MITNITEDFDFNKVKKQHIEDEYKMPPKVIRDLQDSTTMAAVLKTTDFLGNHAIYSYKVPEFGPIYTIKSNINGALIKQLTGKYTYKKDNVFHTYSYKDVLFNELALKIKSYDISFKYQRYSTYPGYNNLKAIIRYAKELFDGIFKDDEYINLPLCDPFKKSEAYIEGSGYISNDGGIVILYNMLILHPSLKYSNSPNIKGFDHDLFDFGFIIAFFTGEVDYKSIFGYNKHIDEDFDFGKVKQKSVEDDYKLNPEIVGKINNELDLTKIIGNVIPEPYVIKPIEYPKFRKLYAPAVDLNFYLWENFARFMDGIGINDEDSKQILDNARQILLNNPNFKFTYNTCKFKYGCPENDDLIAILDLISEAFLVELFNHLSPDKLSMAFCKPFDINTANIVCDYYISLDEGIIFINKLKINHPNFKNCDSRRLEGQGNDKAYIVMFACYFFTNTVPYSTNNYIKINEDFDFNKVKKHHIEDEYEVCHPYIIKPDDVLSKLYNIKIDNASFYLKDNRDYLVYVNTIPYNKDIAIPDNLLKLKDKLRNQLWEIATFNTEYIDKVNNIINNIPDIKKYSEQYDQLKLDHNMYYMIYKAPFNDLYIVYGTLYGNQIYDKNWFMVIYTGDVTYFPELENKIVNEDFDFNKVKSRNTEDEEMHTTILTHIINLNLETIKKNKMLTSIMNLLKYKYSLDFNHISMSFAKCVTSSINGALKGFTFKETQFPIGDTKKHPNEIDIAWQITNNKPNKINLQRIDNFLKNCNFIDVNPDNIIFETNSPRYLEFYDRLCESIEYYDRWTNTTSKELSVNVLKCYVTNDNGIGCMLLEGRFGQLCLMFFYTGIVTYTNDNKLSTQAGINEVKDNFIKKVVSDISKEHYTKSFGWSFVYDKNGYPRIMTVISKNDHFYRVLPSIWYKNNVYTSANWSPKIYSNNPKVIMRRNSNNGLIEMGCFMPWNIESLYGQNEWLIFNRLKLRTTMTMNQFITDYKANPDNYGVYVYLLSPLGKQMFDKYIKEVADKHLSKAKQDELFNFLYSKYRK